MQNLNLEDFKDLQESELKSINGGFIPILAAFIISDLATVAIGMGIYNGYRNAAK